jgi:Cu2+-exporting ATPase
LKPLDEHVIPYHGGTEMGTDTSEGHDAGGCRRDVERAVEGIDGLAAGDVHEAAAESVATSTVGESDDHSVFELTGLDCRTCAGLVERVLLSREGVSNVTASHRHGTARVDYDPERLTAADIRSALSDLGYPVETTDEAFRNRRADQWREARLATGLLAGLMALVPYAAVVYPTRFAFWPYDPRVVALLERALESAFATHFFVNLALLSGIVLLFTGKPLLADAAVALRERSPDRSLAVGALAVGLYVYSSATAFRVAPGGVYYDVVIALVVGMTVWRQAEHETTEAASEDPSETSESVPVAAEGD